MDEEEERRHRSRRAAQGASTVRRKSRVTRQHSYDDEIKNAQLAASGGGNLGGHGGGDAGLGLPVQLARRASAYDVYSPGGGASLAAIVAPQHRSSISAQGKGCTCRY